MKRVTGWMGGLVLLTCIWPSGLALAQGREAAAVDAATNVLREIMEIPARSIPLAMLNNAQGVVIIPGMLKGGFVVGIRHGAGVLLSRDEAGRWSAPSFCTLTGASVGWQIGIQGTDVILVFTTKNSLQGLMRSKITIGADVSAAAGPVGREASVGTDASLRSEIYSYCRSRGLFAGAALDGSALHVDQAATAAYYRAATPLGADPRQPIPLPPEAARLLAQLAHYTTPTLPAPGTSVPMPAGSTAVPVVRPAPAGDDLRHQLAAAIGQLSAILDNRWREYLALPADVDTRQPSVEALRLSLSRLDAVAASPAYGALSSRPEFQSVRDLLRRYLAAQTAPQGAPMQLPAPPQ
jgi:lipid-binding SYLF domain-containing protein